MTTINDNVNVTGGFSAGNWLFGTAQVPIETTSEPNSVEVNQINPSGTGEGNLSGGIVINVTARSAYPWVRVREVSVAGPTTDPGTLEAHHFDIYLWRSTQVTTDVHWMLWRAP